MMISYLSFKRGGNFPIKPDGSIIGIKYIPILESPDDSGQNIPMNNFSNSGDSFSNSLNFLSNEFEFLRTYPNKDINSLVYKFLLDIFLMMFIFASYQNHYQKCQTRSRLR